MVAAWPHPLRNLPTRCRCDYRRQTPRTYGRVFHLRWRTVFDAEWEGVLEAAKHSKDLAGVRDLLAHWRHHAYQELRDPGAYFRVLAIATRAEATRRAPVGSLSEEEITARVVARLNDIDADEAQRR
jgi:hypothetical protein